MKLADYSDRVTADQLDAALHQGSFEGVFHYLKGTPGFVLRIETLDVVAAVRARGWAQAGIDVPFNPSDANGGAMAQTAISYGFPAGSRMYLDIEPGRFAVTPNAWPSAADAWCDGVRAGGFSPGVYGTDATVAACSNHADTIWRAKPGMCDPAGPGLDLAFFAGQRAVQCAQEAHNGVSFDVSYSQFTLGAGMTPEEHDWLHHLTAEYDNYLHPLLVGPNGNDGLLAAFAALQTKVAALSVVSPDATAIRADIAALKADLDSLMLKKA